jgi:hypothetical protein
MLEAEKFHTRKMRARAGKFAFQHEDPKAFDGIDIQNEK